MTQKSQLGQKGEDLACEYLRKGGYKIIKRNERQSWGELDIICQDKDRTLVFVEVKTMTGSENGLLPEDQMNRAKIKKTAKAALLYTGHNQNLVDEKQGWRIDLISIILEPNQSPKITHYKNVVG